MPREVPNCNSSRVQRASRLNNIEDGRLQSKIHLLNKEFRRYSRLANQDMRVINLTLEFIQNSSGHSPEGLPPESTINKGRTAIGPCFMYGERVISRKYRKSLAQRRDSSCSSSNSTTDTSGTDTSSKPSRPQSSPVKRTSYQFIRQRPGTAQPAIVHISNSLSDLSIDSDNEHDNKALIRRPKSAKLAIKATPIIQPPEPPTTPRNQQQAFMTLVDDSSRPVSAKRPRSKRPVSAHAHILERVIDLPATSKVRQTKVIEYKKVLNMDKNKVVENKLRAFIDSLPKQNENDDG